MTFLKTAGAFLILFCWNVSCDVCKTDPYPCQWIGTDNPCSTGIPITEYGGGEEGVEGEEDEEDKGGEVVAEMVCNTDFPFNGSSYGKCLDTNCPIETPTFCKTIAMECKFPFIYKEKEYHGCITFGNNDQSWCPTKLNDDKTIADNRVGICSKSCAIVGAESLTGQDTPKSITVILTSSHNYKVNGSLTFSQEDRTKPVVITGSIYGLTSGEHGFHVHEHGDIGNNCDNSGKHFNPTKSVHGGRDTEMRHLGDFGNIKADDEVAEVNLKVDSITLYDGPNSILGKAIVVHANEDALNDTLDDSGNSGARVACGLILEKRPWNQEIFIIVVSVIVIIILIVLLISIICYCVSKKDPKGREKVPYDDPHGDFPNGGIIKKSPLYDELSIPFIDASPAPTPKTGRSTERLSFFNRTPSIGRSRGSLSNAEN